MTASRVKPAKRKRRPLGTVSGPPSDPVERAPELQAEDFEFRAGRPSAHSGDAEAIASAIDRLHLVISHRLPPPGDLDELRGLVATELANLRREVAELRTLVVKAPEDPVRLPWTSRRLAELVAAEMWGPSSRAARGLGPLSPDVLAERTGRIARVLEEAGLT